MTEEMTEEHWRRIILELQAGLRASDEETSKRRSRQLARASSALEPRGESGTSDNQRAARGLKEIGRWIVTGEIPARYVETQTELEVTSAEPEVRIIEIHDALGRLEENKKMLRRERLSVQRELGKDQVPEGWTEHHTEWGPTGKVERAVGEQCELEVNISDMTWSFHFFGRDGSAGAVVNVQTLCKTAERKALDAARALLEDLEKELIDMTVVEHHRAGCMCAAHLCEACGSTVGECLLGLPCAPGSEKTHAGKRV